MVKRRTANVHTMSDFETDTQDMIRKLVNDLKQRVVDRTLERNDARADAETYSKIAMELKKRLESI
jgi:hypothetical protein